MEFWPSSERKPMKLHIDVNAQAEKEEDMREDTNIHPIAPATANLYFRPLAGGLVIVITDHE